MLWFSLRRVAKDWTLSCFWLCRHGYRALKLQCLKTWTLRLGYLMWKPMVHYKKWAMPDCQRQSFDLQSRTPSNPHNYIQHWQRFKTLGTSELQIEPGIKPRLARWYISGHLTPSSQDHYFIRYRSHLSSSLSFCLAWSSFFLPIYLSLLSICRYMSLFLTLSLFFYISVWLSPSSLSPHYLAISLFSVSVSVFLFLYLFFCFVFVSPNLKISLSCIILSLSFGIPMQIKCESVNSLLLPLPYFPSVFVCFPMVLFTTQEKSCLHVSSWNPSKLL